MKIKNIKELHIKTKQELKNLLKQFKDELFSLKLENSRGKLKNTRSIFEKKKDIARILTVIREGDFVNENA